MFSSITMASSTTKPTDSVIAMSERLSSEYPSTYITAKVATSEKGNARLGMRVADKFRRNRKITRITSTSDRNKVNLTSLTESRIDADRSYRVSSFTEAGICARKVGNSFLMESTTSTVLVPGWR